MTPTAQEEFHALPSVILIRVRKILFRLTRWPAVSGAKPLRGELAGHWRIRTGDYRVIFKPSADDSDVLVWKIGNRGDIYD